MPGKPFDQMTKEDVKKLAETGLSSQETPLDQLWYLINFGAYTYSIIDARSSSIDLAERLDKIPDDPEELEKAKKAYQKEYAMSYFSDEEKRRLKIPVDRQTERGLVDEHAAMSEQLKNDLFRAKNLDEVVRRYMLLGLLQAKVAMEMGRDYGEKLDSIPEGEEFREEKAFHLLSKEANSRVAHLSKSYGDFQTTAAGKLYMRSGAEKILKGTPVESPDSVRTCTIGEFFAASLTSREEMEKLFADNRRDGFECDENMTVYEYFRRQHQWSEQRKSKAYENYQIVEADEESLCLQAQEQFRKDLMKNAQRLGVGIVRGSLSEKDRKLFDAGYKALATIEYKTPKPIRAWARETAEPRILRDRIDQINESYDHFGKEAGRKTPYGLENDPVYREAFGNHLGDRASPYEQFIHSHLGVCSIEKDKKERRESLALVMAARAAEAASPGSFSREKIDEAARTIRSRDAFRDLTDEEVFRALSGKQAALSAQRKVYRQTFGVPEGERAAYVREMKALSETMVPGNGQSARYRAMAEAVSAIGKLDPNDPLLEEKLVSANAALVGSVTAYAKGKKSLRAFSSSQARFDNGIDALAVAARHVPGLVQFAREIVDRTNEVRKAQPGDKGFVSLADYGTERALAHAPANAAIHQQAEPEGPAFVPKPGL